MTRVRRLIGSLALSLTAASMATAAIAQELRLTVANGIASTIPTHWWFKDFIGPQLEQRSGGKIKANVQVNGTLCSEHKCVEQAGMGQIDIGSVSAGNIGSFGQTFDILNLPYIFKDDAAAESLVNGWLGKELATRAAKEMNLHVIAIIPSYSFRNVGNSKREVRVPEDLKGLKIRVTKSPVELNLIKTWGATAVPFDWAQVYEGLSTGVIDGYYVPDAYVAAQKFYEVSKFLTQTGGGWNAHIIFMNRKRYERLPEWAKNLIDELGREIGARSFKVDAEWMAQQNKLLDGKLSVYRPNQKELDRWYAGAPAAWLAVKGTYDKALARRALTDQNQAGLIKVLESAGAL
ncbi:MAG TPA: TRAP transporter substrate-binding protein [Burkholderiaceae bacterium]|nr:TRAP transporter substrate-binding protein [Burkholderiaceae bacterium]